MTTAIQNVVIDESALPVHGSYVVQGEFVREADCNDYEEFQLLPSSVQSNYNLLLTPRWNADKKYTCCKSQRLGQHVDIVV